MTDTSGRVLVSAVLLLLCCQGIDPLNLVISRPSPPLSSSLRFSFNSRIRNISLTDGREYSLQCSMPGVVVGLIQWYKGSALITISNTSASIHILQTVDSKVLVFTSFSGASEGGTYRCETGQDSGSFVITSGNPVAIATRDEVYIEGATHINRPTLSVFYDGNPLPLEADLRWTFNGGMVKSPTIVASNQVILSTTLTHAESGIYAMTVNNSAGVITATTKLIVTFRPSVVLSPMNTLVVRGNEPITIVCSDSVGFPRSTLSWWIKGVLVNQSGDGIVLSDLSNSTSAVQQLQIEFSTNSRSGAYVCVADNSFEATMNSNSQTIDVTVMGPLPPGNIEATPTSSCEASIDWTDSPLSMSVKRSEAYIIDIQYATNEGRREWKQLLLTNAHPISARLFFVETNTSYMLRGRGFTNSYGISDISEIVGPFVTYPNEELPTPVNVLASWNAVRSLRVLWEAPVGCYQLVNFTIACLEAGASSDREVKVTSRNENSAIVTGLKDDKYYDCRVSGNVTAMGLDNLPKEVPSQERYSAAMRTFTLPAVPASPDLPETVDGATMGFLFNVIFKPLSPNFNISHYQIIVLRLERSSVPNIHPDNLYPSTAAFSTCDIINDPENRNGLFQPYIAAEISAAEFKTNFVVGEAEDNGNTGEICNGKLLPDVSYTLFLRAFPSTLDARVASLQEEGARRRRQAVKRQYVVFASSSFLKPVIIAGLKRSISTTTLAIVVALIVIVLVASVIACLVGCYYYKGRHRRVFISHPRSRSISSTSSESSLPYVCDTPDLAKKTNVTREAFELKAPFDDPLEPSFEPSGEIKRADFAAHVETFDAKRQLLFQEEFDWITKHSPWHKAEASEDPLNDSKNRYSNITAFDHSRVRLTPREGVECSDYINANFITGHNRSKEYIASQGPLEQTVEDFWRMVWDQNSTTIIMLTNVIELGKTKCSQYWPNSFTTMYGSIAVTLDNTHTFPDYTIRTLSVQLLSHDTFISSNETDDTRRVLQFHYTKWPDYGTPKLAAPLLNFLKIVHESNNTEENTAPIVVHCSAGVGRSGTVLTIDHCLQQLRDKGMVNVCGFVQQMRNERNYLVQTDQQYTFIHYAILEAIIYGDTSFEVDKFLESYEKMQSKSNESEKMLLEEEFQRLGVVKTMVKKSSFQNRILVKGAPQRHFHSSFHGGSSIQQCLGHILDSYNQSSMFVVTEGPDVRTSNRFWEMVWDYDCGHIIMLSPLDDENFFQYWPSGVNEEFLFGSIKVVVENESAEHLYTCRTIRILNTKMEGISHQVVQYQFMGWTLKYLPRVPDFMSFFCNILKAKGLMENKSKVMVHDTASMGPVGIFCSLFRCIQRLQIEKVIDIFQAVQFVQLQRPGSVSTLGDYAFIYDCMHEFLVRNS